MKKIVKSMAVMLAMMSLAAVPAMAATTTNTATTETTTQAVTENTLFQKLQGKKLDLNYTSGDHYIVTVLSETQLNWLSIGTSDGGPTTETEAYTVREVGQDVYFVSWMEQSGMTVSEVIDLKQGKVYATITWADGTKANGRDSVAIEGTASIIDK